MNKPFLFTLLALSLSPLATAFVEDILKYRDGQGYFFTSDKDGKLTVVDLSPVVENERKYDPETQTKLQLYTRRNVNISSILIKGNISSVENSNFDFNKPTKVVIHGWGDDGDGNMFARIKNAFLDVMDANIITVDWSEGDSSIYPIAVSRIPPLGRFLGSFIDWLITLGCSAEDFHIIGHSLGSHAAGITGRSVSQENGKVAYITGIDPAAPLWDSNSERIRSSDAEYVEIIHGNAGALGIPTPLGHNDFYPNGGSLQPGCLIVDVACSHNRAASLFIYSIDNTKFQANLCADHNEAMSGTCSNLGKLHMGGSKPKPKMGSFYLETTSTPPYYE